MHPINYVLLAAGCLGMAGGTLLAGRLRLICLAVACAGFAAAAIMAVA